MKVWIISYFVRMILIYLSKQSNLPKKLNNE